MRLFVTLADAAIARATIVADLGGLVVGFAVVRRDHAAGARSLIILALALLASEAGIAEAHAAHGRAVALALCGIRSKSLFVTGIVSLE